MVDSKEIVRIMAGLAVIPNGYTKMYRRSIVIPSRGVPRRGISLNLPQGLLKRFLAMLGMTVVYLCLLLPPSSLFAQSCLLEEKIINLPSPTLGATCNPQDYVGRDHVLIQPGFVYQPQAGRSLLARVDNSMILPALYGTMPDVDNHVLNTGLPFGSTPGAGSVSPSGGATYQIPIHIPPGTAGMQPSISLVYNSQAGNGQLGWGWNLGGFSAITRVGQTVYHDDKVDAVSLDFADRFALDGNRLVHVNGIAHGTPGALYRTEAETFRLITAAGVEGSGPQSFEVKTKDGLIMIYGGNSGSRFTTGLNGTVVSWRISKIIDQNGNYMEFTYLNDNSESRIDEINYTGNSGQGLTPYNAVKFYYEEREDRNEQWIAGLDTKVKNRYLVRMIRVSAEGKMVKEYKLKYAKGHTAGLYSMLTEVTERSPDSKLNSTLFEYGQSNSFTQTGVGVFTSNTDSIPMDYNGDGVMDLAVAHFLPDGNGFKNYLTYEIFNVVTSQVVSSGVFPANSQSVSSGSSGFKSHSILSSSDFTGDGFDDLFVLTLGQYYSGPELFSMSLKVLKSNGSNFVLDYTTQGFLISSQAPLVGDFNGDGVSDIALFNNQSDLNGTPVNLTIIIDVKNQTSNIIANLPGVFESDTKYSIDFDGDGKSEILAVGPTGSRIITFNPALTSYSLLYTLGFPTESNTIHLGDFNGDGKTDLLTKVGSAWEINYATGTGFFGVSFPYSLSGTNTKVKIGDFNGDGKSDIFFARTIIDVSPVVQYFLNLDLGAFGYFFNAINDDISTNIVQQAYVYYSHGNGFASQNYMNNSFSGVVVTVIKPALSLDLVTFNKYNTFKPKSAVAADFTGDGKQNIVHRFPNRGNELLSFNPNGRDHLLSKITNGVNYKTEFSYQTLTSGTVYNKGTGATYPLMDFQGPLHVVSSMFTPDGLGGFPSTVYKYEAAKLHRQGKGFLGFETVTTENITLNRKTVLTSELNTTFYDMRPVSQTVESISGTPISTTTFVNDEISYGGLRYFPFVSISTSTDHLTGIFNTEFSFFNNDGNQYQHNTTYSGDGSISTVNLFTTFDSSNPWWIPSRLQRSTVTKVVGTEPSYVRRVDYTYNDQGQVATQVNDADKPAKSVTTTNTYNNPFGNISKTEQSAPGLVARFEDVEFDIKGRFITKKTNALGHISVVSYEPAYGNITQQTAIDGQVSVHSYDAFGRLTQTVTPEGNTITTDRDWITGTPANALYFVRTQAPGVSAVKTFYDGLGRSIRTEKDGFSDVIAVDQEYNSDGTLNRVSHPYYAGSGTQKWITYGYEPTYRYVKSEQNHTLANPIQYVIAGRTTFITDPVGRLSKQTIDGYGNLVIAIDPGGPTVNYVYHSSGQPKSITAASVTTLMAYDGYGRQTQLTDPNAGTVQYVYNAYGELESQTDANSVAYTMTYDQLGRLTSKQTGSDVYSYTYVASGNGLANIESVTGPNNINKSYEYDSHGRLSKRIENIQGDVLETSLEYDNFGKLTKQTYPSGYAIDKVYNANTGYLTEVNDPQGTIYTTDAMNAFNQYTNYTLGNGISTQRTYDDFGRLFQTVSGSVQNMVLSWNNNRGDLNFRIDNIKGLVETFSTDNLNRLEDYQVTSQPLHTVGYLPNGNIQDKTDVGDYVYSPTQPHAVVQIDNTVNTIPSLSQDITYTPFNKTASIVEGDYELFFTYGTENQRRKTELKYQTNLQRTITYSGSYEKIEDATDIYEVHYIVCGPGLTAVNVKQNGGANQLYYAYTDYLGSILTLTNATGGVIYEQNFDPWGRKRNPNAWDYSSNPNTKPLWLTRGFTGHEHLDEFGLVNMNGRMYDPLLGRVLSVDNFVQDNTSTQGYNRYSYALNNPLIYTDPTGEIVGFIIAGVVIGAYLGGSLAENNLNPGQWAWDGNTWKGIGTGALIGGATGGLIGAMWQSGAAVTIAVDAAGTTVPLVSFSQAGFSTANTVAGLIGAGGAASVGLASIDWTAVEAVKNREAEVIPGPLENPRLVDGEIYTDWDYNPVIAGVYNATETAAPYVFGALTLIPPVGAAFGGTVAGGRAVSYATGGVNQWLRVGASTHKGVTSYSVRWGAGNTKYLNQIGNPRLREWNRQLRKWRRGHMDLWRM